MANSNQSLIKKYLLLLLIVTTSLYAQDKEPSINFISESTFTVGSDFKNNKELFQWSVTIPSSQEFSENIYTNFYGARLLQLSSEINQAYWISNNFSLVAGITYDYGRTNTLLTVQEYIPNISEISLYGLFQYAINDYIQMELNYQWGPELAVAEDPTVSISGPLMAGIAINVSKGNWQLQLLATKLSNFPWDGAVFDIENQELGELQAPEELLFRPDSSISISTTLSFSF